MEKTNTYKKSPFKFYQLGLNSDPNLYKYDPNNIDILAAQMFFPELVPSGSSYDTLNLGVMRLAFTQYRKDGSSKPDLAHTTPGAINLRSGHTLIAFGPNEPYWPTNLLQTTTEEIPHAWAYLNGFHPAREMVTDLVLYGGNNQGSTYTTTGAFENLAHGKKEITDKKGKKLPKNEEEIKKTVQTLGLTPYLVDFDGDGKVDYNIPVLDPKISNNPSKNYKNALWTTPAGYEYWTHAFGLGKISEEEFLKATEKLRNYLQEVRNDAYYDTAWNKNLDTWASVARHIGFTDGGDVARILNLFNPIIDTLETTSISRQQLELSKKEEELKKAFVAKKISKEDYEKHKELYKKAQESINRHRDNFYKGSIVGDAVNTVNEAKNIIKEATKGNVRGTAKSVVKTAKSAAKTVAKTVDTGVGAELSFINSFNNSIRTKIPKRAKKAVKKAVYSVGDAVSKNTPEPVKKVVKKVLPKVKKTAHKIWNKVPDGNIKDALRDNPILRGVRNVAKHYGWWKYGGILTILDILTY